MAVNRISSGWENAMGRIEEFELPIEPLAQSPRKIWVYLPDDYDESRKRYPVLYMFDGHNLFDDSLATYGKSWGIRDYLDGAHLPLVVIGQDCNHTGNARLEEYSPFQPDSHTWIGKLNAKGEITGEWFAHTLKPACEKRYRISKNRKQVGIAGSSMGGLMSMYMIAKYNDLYSKAACVSSTMDIYADQITDLIDHSSFSHDTRIYLDFGSNEVKAKKTFARCMDYLLRINHTAKPPGRPSFPCFWNSCIRNFTSKSGNSLLFFIANKNARHPPDIMTQKSTASSGRICSSTSLVTIGTSWPKA